MALEFELKFAADPKVFPRIQEELGSFTPISMETTYLDTPDGAISARRWMLRRRLENGRALYTLKTPLPGSARGEWESAAPSWEGALEELLAQGAPQALKALTSPGLIPTCGAQFTRLVKTISHRESTLELALDAGKFLAPGREAPFAEVEVELKAGSQDAAVDFAQSLAARFDLHPQEKSKAQRARELGRP